MSSFILIIACFSLGIFFRINKIFPESTPLVLNRFIIYISLPALALKELHRIPLKAENIPAVAMPWIVFLCGALFFWGLNRLNRIPPKTLGTLILTGSLGNTSFVGFPLLEAFFGASALSVGVLVDQPGTFLAAGTLGVFVACYFSSKKPSASVIFKKILLFPPFQAVLVSVFLRPFIFPETLNLILEKLAATLIPLSLVVVGFQLQLDKQSLKREWKPLLWGLGYKLILAPLLISIIYIGIFRLQGTTVQIILMESAMAPMITAGILASEYGLNSVLGSLMIGLGIPLSLITVPLWNFIFAALV